jgi:hypothetical protein
LITSPEILDEYRRVGEMLAEEHPVIDLEPMLEYVIHNAVVFFSPRFLNAFVTIRMTINFLPVRWQAEVISLSAATGIFSKCQDNKTLKS